MRRRRDDGNDIRTFARDRDQNGARFIFWKCSTMLARHPLSADLLNFGAKTIQINNSPNTFICDTGERNIPGLIDVLIIIFNQPNHHRTNQKLRIHFSELCSFGTSVSFPPSPFFNLLCSRPNFLEDLGWKLLLRRLPAEVLNVMITAAAKITK